MSEDRSNLTMPGRLDLVDQAIARLDTAGLRSKIVGLDTATLRDVCLRLTDRSCTIADAHRWLNEALGGDDETQLIDDNVVYRFAPHFRRLYGQVRAEHARRIARLSVAHATGDSISAMTRLSQHRLIELTAERLVEAENLEDLDGGEIKAVMFATKFAQDSLAEAEKIEIKRRQAEDRARKLEAEVERIKLDIDKRERDRLAAIAAAKKDVGEKAKASGDGKLTASDVYELFDRISKGEA